MRPRCMQTHIHTFYFAFAFPKHIAFACPKHIAFDFPNRRSDPCQRNSNIYSFTLSNKHRIIYRINNSHEQPYIGTNEQPNTRTNE